MNIYCLVAGPQRCKQAARSCYADAPRWKSKLQPLDRKFDALSAAPQRSIKAEAWPVKLQVIFVLIFVEKIYLTGMNSKFLWLICAETQPIKFKLIE